MRVLVTGSAGFIGFHLCRKLLDAGHLVDGFDGMTSYYNVALKRRRHEILARSNGFRAHLAMLEDVDALERCVATAQPDVVVHLAAQAGVRYSLENPRAYVSSNLVGTFNLLEAVRNGVTPAPHLMLASTSSVYGANTVMPFVEDQRTDHPLTLYAATKKGTEEMAHSWSHLWGTPTTIFRFFTVYGPWGRPDMAMFKFVEAILNERPIEIYNNGNMKRDFTYVDDLVDAIIRLAAVPPASRPEADWDISHSPVAPFRVVNIGRGAPVSLLDFVDEIEHCLGRKAIRDYRPMQPGDVPETFADCTLLERLTGSKPSTDLRTGVAHFVDWYMGWRAEAAQTAPAVSAA